MGKQIGSDKFWNKEVKYHTECGYSTCTRGEYWSLVFFMACLFGGVFGFIYLMMFLVKGGEVT